MFSTKSKMPENMEPRLSLERAEEILRNVYKAVGVTPPENCSEILRRGGKNEMIWSRKSQE